MLGMRAAVGQTVPNATMCATTFWCTVRLAAKHSREGFLPGPAAECWTWALGFPTAACLCPASASTAVCGAPNMCSFHSALCWCTMRHHYLICLLCTATLSRLSVSCRRGGVCASIHFGLSRGAAGVPALSCREDPRVGHQHWPHPQARYHARQCDDGEGQSTRDLQQPCYVLPAAAWNRCFDIYSRLLCTVCLTRSAAGWLPQQACTARAPHL